MAQLVKSLPAMPETWVQSLCWEDPLEKGTSPETGTFWPGEFHGLYSPWGRKESDMTERLSRHFTFSLKFITLETVPDVEYANFIKVSGNEFINSIIFNFG